MLIWIYGDYIFISNLYFPRSHHLHARWALYLAVLTILQLQELSVCCQRGTASPGTDYKTLIQRLPVDRRVKSTNTYIQVLRKALEDTENNGCFQWTTLRGCYIMGRFLMISWPPSILGTKACNPGEYSYTLLRSIILERGVPPGSPNPDPISDPNISFSTTIFRPCLYNITSSLLGLQRQQQILLKNYFQSAYFSFFPLICDWLQYKVRSKWANLYPFRD